MKQKSIRLTIFLLLMAPVALFGPRQAYAHCDGMDGPVVKAARKALETGNVKFILIWVRKSDETEVKKTFEKTLAVRRLSPEARELADLYFFGTVVRIHRAGEGAPYTGLKSDGRDLGPAIPAADKALETGSAESLVTLLTQAVKESLHQQFKNVLAAKGFAKDDVAAGRRFVKAYVEFIHYVERLYDAATDRAEGHFRESVSHVD